MKSNYILLPQKYINITIFHILLRFFRRYWWLLTTYYLNGRKFEGNFIWQLAKL